MPVNWRTAQSALRQWILATSGFGDQFVIWKHENGNAPTSDYIDVSLGTLVPLGIDCQLDSTDLARPAGQEVEIRIEGDREFTVALEAYSKQTTDKLSEATARSVLSRVMIGIQLPSVRYALAQAGMSVVDIGSVQWLPALGAMPNDTKISGRALLEVRLYVRDDIAERTGYIKTVEVMDAVGGGVITIDSP